MSSGLGRRLMGSLFLGVVVALLVAAAAVFVLGRPPHTFRIAAGAEGGMYEAFSQDLSAELARQGFDLQIIETAGSIDNAALLREQQADIGLIQSGTENLADIGASTALAEVFYEPIWLFYRTDSVEVVDGVAQLDGKLLGIGPEGSGTHALALELIAEAGITPITVPTTTTDAVDALRSGALDAAIFVVAPNAPIVGDLAAIPDLGLLSLEHTDGISRRLPYLSAVTLPAGVLDPAADVPPEDVPMLAARATLMGRGSLHPDLARLVVQSLPAVMPLALVGDPHAFPSLEGTQLPVNADAQKFYAEGPTPLERFLPFEIASPLSRIYLVLLPLLVLAFPLWTLTKAGIAWFMRGRINNWYPRIHAIERGIDSASLGQLEENRDFLRAVAAQLETKTRVPAGYGAAYYDLRIDLQYVMERVEGRIAVLRAAQDAGGSEAVSEAAR